MYHKVQSVTVSKILKKKCVWLQETVFSCVLVSICGGKRGLKWKKNKNEVVHTGFQGRPRGGASWMTVPGPLMDKASKQDPMLLAQSVLVMGRPKQVLDSLKY